MDGTQSPFQLWTFLDTAGMLGTWIVVGWAFWTGRLRRGADCEKDERDCKADLGLCRQLADAYIAADKARLDRLEQKLEERQGQH